ncbi:bleomycin resistance protein [Pseudonocardia alaniniphila]|uniref:VOC family protein n=1 Tax=Pseudonocardia alaniniphila TaxID=75291 RepID=A0ABS9TRS6_9PSEU|nr:VOC family protein [Pseudonocardia alaniniphila]MCH6171257.1 VOC family protein [Pseudonocardia alaniniphila]
MRTELVIPGLPCRDLDDVLPFYAALGFDVTYRQERPSPYAVVRRGGIELHFFSIPEFDPANSMGSVCILVPDTGALHSAFAAGLRAAFGKLPVSGIPRMTRPRRRQGTPAGFTVVDPGGNWLRISRHADDGDEPAVSEGRLARAVAAAARQADSRGDESAGIRVLENGLARHADAPPVQRLPALVYLAELRLRTGDREAAAALLAEVGALDLSAADREALTTDLATAGELAADLGA